MALQNRRGQMVSRAAAARAVGGAFGRETRSISALMRRRPGYSSGEARRTIRRGNLRAIRRNQAAGVRMGGNY